MRKDDPEESARNGRPSVEGDATAEGEAAEGDVAAAEADPAAPEGEDAAAERGDPAGRQGPSPAEVSVPQPGKPASRFAAWWSAPATVLTVLLVIAVLLSLTVVLGVVAFRRGAVVDAARGPIAASIPAPTRTAAPTQPTEKPSTGVDARPPVDPSVLGVRYTSGAYQANDGTFIDFDGNDRSGRRTDESDIQVDSFGITGLNAVPLSVVGSTDPILMECSAIPAEDWVVTVPAEELTEGTRVCFRTTDQRYGFFTVMNVRYTNSDTLLGVRLSYLVWKGPDDDKGD